ncbi:MarR family winged helix-turn-helix transcriptional regulator [Streptomyces sp. NPDC088789]|uniref:MarR family winged helix-turn-helix transcriptional regulator n=1 Tax=Streptomyces sp. NPDC088789 TaxID=3365899 RepID=UPI003812D03B
MAEPSQYAELARQLGAVGAVKRDMARVLPASCPTGTLAVLTSIDRYGDMRIGRLSELLAVDMSVTSRHVTHCVERGWIERICDPTDKRSRILRLTPAGREVLAELRLRMTSLLADRLRDWDEDDLSRLIGLMNRLLESFGAAVPARPG